MLFPFFCGMIQMQMRRIYSRGILVLLLCLVPAALVFAPPKPRISIRVSGTWKLTIDQTHIVGGAGSDIQSTYESTGGDVYLVITKSEGTWTMDIRRADTTWHADFTISARRSSDGTGIGTITGGTTYQAITTTDQYFFEGSDDRSNVDIQYQLSGMSMAVPAGTYITTIYYTVTD